MVNSDESTEWNMSKGESTQTRTERRVLPTEQGRDALFEYGNPPLRPNCQEKPTATVPLC